MKTVRNFLLALAVTAGFTLGGAAQAQASVGYISDSCSVASTAWMTASKWFNDSRTLTTYHWGVHDTSTGYSVRSFSIGSSGDLTGSDSNSSEGYYYFNSGSTSLRLVKVVFQKYVLGVPTTTPSCSFYL